MCSTTRIGGFHLFDPNSNMFYPSLRGKKLGILRSKEFTQHTIRKINRTGWSSILKLSSKSIVCSAPDDTDDTQSDQSAGAGIADTSNTMTLHQGTSSGASWASWFGSLDLSKRSFSFRASSLLLRTSARYLKAGRIGLLWVWSWSNQVIGLSFWSHLNRWTVRLSIPFPLVEPNRGLMRVIPVIPIQQSNRASKRWQNAGTKKPPGQTPTKTNMTYSLGVSLDPKKPPNSFYLFLMKCQECDGVGNPRFCWNSHRFRLRRSCCSFRASFSSRFFRASWQSQEWEAQKLSGWVSLRAALDWPNLVHWQLVILKAMSNMT